MTDTSRMTAGLFSNRTDEWGTPRALFAALDAEFNFTPLPRAGRKAVIGKRGILKPPLKIKSWSAKIAARQYRK